MPNMPLAERMRPKNLDEYIGQQHLVGEGAVLRNMINTGRIQSIILWGPPGVGKTTLARIIAKSGNRAMYTLSYERREGRARGVGEGATRCFFQHSDSYSFH